MIRGTKIIISFAIVLITVGALGMASYVNTQRLIKNNEWVTQTHEVLETLGDVLSVLKDAETGQRGFILTGRNDYLEPYDQAIGSIGNRLARLNELTKDNSAQQAALIRLETLSASKLDELGQAIELRRRSGLEAAMAVIRGDRGKKIMDDIRDLIAQMQGREQKLLRSRQEAAASTARWTEWTITGAIPLALLMIAVAAIILMHSGRSGGLVVGPPVEAAGWQKTAVRYAFPAAAVVLASLVRLWLQKLGPMPLFITYYPAVLLVAMVSGGGPGIATTVLSGLVADYYFISPYGSLAVESPSDLLALVFFLGTNLSLCVVAERLRRSRWAEAFGLAKQQEAEELARKNEELAQQSEELSQQSEELAQQNEEIQSLNTELTGREGMLRKLLEATRLPISEGSVLTDICAATRDIFGPSASAAVVCERQGDQLHIRAQAGLSQAPERWPIENSFIELVLQEGRTACLNDATLRPDLKLLQIAGEEPFRSALSSPLRVGGELFGAVTVYSLQKQEWTAEQFRLAEWLATQCGHILDTLRPQDQLRQMAERNRLLSDLLGRSEQPFGIGYPDGKLGYVNAAFERLTGYGGKELAAMDWANALTPPEWRALEQAKLEGLHLTGQPARYEKEYLRKDGTRVPIELLVHLIKDDRGVPLYYYSFITDITERRQAEEALRRSEEGKRAAEVLASAEREFRLLAEAMPQIVWTTRSDGWTTYFNHQWVEYTGLTLEESYGHGWNKPFHPEDQQRAWDAWQNAVTNLASYALECRLRRSDGVYRWWLIRGIPVSDEKGNILKWFGTCTDIDDLKRAEEALRQANADLGQRAAQLQALAGELTLAEQRERSRLAKILHDHLQQLLVAAKFRAAVLGRGGDEVVKQATEEVENLIDESIAVSRDLTAELSPPILHEAGLNAGLQWLARRMADKHGLFVDLTMEEDGQIPEQLKVLVFDSVRELLFNVVKHAHTSSAAINLRRVDGRLQVTVSDPGVGFDPTIMHAAGGGGVGFGLFGIRERLELMGGVLQIQSTPGQGSLFVLSVPVAPITNIEPQSRGTLVLPDADPRIGYSDPRRRIRVMLADDHVVVRQGIAKLLGDEPEIEVVGAAGDGQEAVEMAAKLLPDVILMDLSMPKLNGIEATQAIHKEFPQIRIVGISMFEETERAQAIFEAGAVGYLTKSGAAETLVAAVLKHGAR